MSRWRALWGMARKNLRQAWLRNLVLALALTLAIAGDLLLGLFFTGLETRAGAMAATDYQNVPMVVFAPADVNMESWLSWSRYAGGFYGSRNYEEAATFAWREGFTPAGRTRLMAVSFETPAFRSLAIEGRWPFAADEVALPSPLATELDLGPGDQVPLTVAGEASSVLHRITGVFVPEALGPDRGPRTIRERDLDDSLNFPLLAVRPTGSEADRWPANGALITVRAADAAALERRMRSYLEREYPVQPALRRTSLVEPVFMRPDMGSEQGSLLGRQIFAPGRRALAASFVFVGTGIFVILLIAFIERKRELAVLKTVGMNNNMVLNMVLLELGAVAAVALALGSGLALGVGNVVAQAVEYVPPPTVGAWLWAFVHTAAVLGLATILPVSMMRLASVQQLLQNERLYLWRKRVTL